MSDPWAELQNDTLNDILSDKSLPIDVLEREIFRLEVLIKQKKGVEQLIIKQKYEMDNLTNQIDDILNQISRLKARHRQEIEIRRVKYRNELDDLVDMICYS